MLRKSLTILMALALLGCSDGGQSRDETIAVDTGTGVELGQDTGGSTTEWETDFETDDLFIGDTDYSLPCYPYRVFNYNNWILEPGPTDAKCINNNDDLVVRVDVSSTDLLYVAIKTGHFYAFSERFYGDSFIRLDFDTDSEPASNYLLGFYPVKINDNGTIAGNGHDLTAKDKSKAFYWKSDLVFKRIFSDEDESFVTGLNNADKIVGYVEDILPPVDSDPAVFVRQSYFFKGDGDVTYMNPLPAAQPTADRVQALALNNADLVVGKAQDANGDWKPFTWLETGVPQYTVLDTLAGATGTGVAMDVNDNDPVQIVGQSEDSDEVLMPTLWTDGVPESLGPLLPGTDSGIAVAINSHGDIVGYDNVIGGEDIKPWLYTGGTKTPLEDLYSQETDHLFTEMVDINDNGIIVGTAELVNGAGPYAVGLIPRVCPADTSQ